VGKQKVYKKGEMFIGKLWITNDRLEDVNGAELTWKLVNNESRAVVKQGRQVIDIPKDTARIVGTVMWEVPATAKAGEYTVEMEVRDREGERLSYNDFEFAVQM